MTESRWEQPDWLAAAHAWIDARLGDLGRARTGAVEQPHVRSWATALRVPTDAGTVWFKASVPELGYEAALVDVLARLDPDLVPPLLAWEPESGWMLMEDAGATLRSAEDESTWLAGWSDVLTPIRLRAAA